MDRMTETDNTNKSVAYVCNEDLLKLSNRHPKFQGRASVVHALIQEYGLTSKMRLVSPRFAREEELSLFHSIEYIRHLRKLSDCEDEEKEIDEESDQFGLTYDCPAFRGVYEFASYITGGTLRAAQSLILGVVDVAIHWPGGWHHAKRDEASGFCYFNDIVVAILKLRQKFDRVLYVDIDLHHGDGVEDAFCATPKVMTVSFHKQSPGFYPGTGKLSDVGIGKGKYYTVNVPLKDGVQDEQYFQIFQKVMSEVHERFRPDAVVCQCGADGLVEDPMNSFNLTPRSYVECVRLLKSWKKPLLLVGGGGYHTPNTARCWASITAAVLGTEISDDIPEHRYFPLYGPDYSLSLSPGNRPNHVSDDYLTGVLTTIQENLQNVQVF